VSGNYDGLRVSQKRETHSVITCISVNLLEKGHTLLSYTFTMTMLTAIKTIKLNLLWR